MGGIKKEKLAKNNKARMSHNIANPASTDRIRLVRTNLLIQADRFETKLFKLKRMWTLPPPASQKDRP